MSAVQEIVDERLRLGQRIGGFTLNDFDLAGDRPHVGLIDGGERRVVRQNAMGLWCVRRYTRDGQGWVADKDLKHEPMATFADAMRALAWETT